MNDPKKRKRVVKNSIGRVLFIFFALLSQIIWLVLLIARFGDYFPYITVGMQVAAIMVVIAIYSQRRSSAGKMLWITLTLAFPIFGIVLFLLVGQPLSIRITHRRNNTPEMLIPRVDTCEAPADDPSFASQAAYLNNWCRYPTYNNTEVTYHGDTKEAYPCLLAELKKAQKFIFMEYHAVQEGISFGEIEKILIEKAAAGVEVRLLYDDVGSAPFVNSRFARRMNDLGIHCRVFNPLVPFVQAFMNHRDHRKMTIIDGLVGFTGGYNLADEYFNLVSPYGYWKDTGIVMRGPAVNSLTVIFMELWNYYKGDEPEAEKYLSAVQPDTPNDHGYVIPYADSPLDNERVGENAYLNALKTARKRAWFTTPYLILDDEMISEITLAAKRGVDVRIITPGIPDKKIVFQLSRSYYSNLMSSNVRIFEFSPGFIHSKQLLIDDDTAIVGTINLDYRSLYLHFENGVMLHSCPCIKDIESTYNDLFEKSREIDPEEIKNRSIFVRIIQNILRLFAPLL